MDVRVLLLSNNEVLVSDLPSLYRQSEIGRFDVIRTVEKIEYVWLKNLYNVIMVDAFFCGTVEDTAFLIRRLRQHFCNPIICLYDGEGFPDRFFPLQVAGCNFFFPFGIPAGAGGIGVPSVEMWQNYIQDQFVVWLAKISEELNKPHQRVTLY